MPPWPGCFWPFIALQQWRSRAATTGPRDLWPTLFDFPLTDYALIGAIGLASFGVAVASVARQRHGDAPAVMPRIVDIPRIPGGSHQPVPVPVSHLVRDAGAGVVRPEVQWTAGADDRIGARDRDSAGVRDHPSHRVRPPLRHYVADALRVFRADPGVNAFGIRWRQGRAYASAFEATQPYGTARLAGLKVLVRSVCMLPALIAVGLSVMGIPVIHRGRQGLRAICAVGCV